MLARNTMLNGGFKVKKEKFPVYEVREFQRPATCEHGADCNPAENPAHHVLIDLSDEARAIIRNLADYLEEAHDAEKRARHYGDPGGASTCSYCKAVKAGRALLNHAREK